MSMIGNYRRIKQTRLDELLARPEQLSYFLYPDGDDDDSAHLDIDKTWHIIHFLLNDDAWEGTWPLVGVVMGGTEISDEDVGYGPARYLTPDAVKEVSRAVSAISPDALWARFDADAVQQAEIYPEVWSSASEDQSYVTGYYQQLQDFFAAAAASGEAVIIYLN